MIDCRKSVFSNFNGNSLLSLRINKSIGRILAYCKKKKLSNSNCDRIKISVNDRQCKQRNQLAQCIVIDHRHFLTRNLLTRKQKNQKKICANEIEDRMNEKCMGPHTNSGAAKKKNNRHRQNKKNEKIKNTDKTRNNSRE